MNYKKINDEELAKILLSGNLSAFDEVYRRYYGSMLGIATSKVKDVNIAKDLVQDVFMKFYGLVCDKKVVASGGVYGMKPLLSKMTYNICIDTLRKYKKINFINAGSTEYLEAILSSYGKDQFDLNQMEIDQTNEKYQEIARAIRKLPKNQRLVIKLRYGTGLSFLEIAKQQGGSVNTWLGRMRYALINIRKTLKIKRKNKKVV